MDGARLSASSRPHFSSRQTRLLQFGRFVGRCPGAAVGISSQGVTAYQPSPLKLPKPSLLEPASALLLSWRRLRRRRNLRRTLLSTLWRRCWRRFHILQFDVKNQGRVRTDVRTHCALAIREGRGNEQLILCSLLHQLKRFRPAFDHSVDRKGRRLTALVRTVKLRPIDQGAPIIHCHHIGGFGRRSRSFFLYLVLQTARSRFHTGFLLVVFKKLRAVSFVFFA